MFTLGNSAIPTVNQLIYRRIVIFNDENIKIIFSIVKYLCIGLPSLSFNVEFYSEICRERLVGVRDYKLE